MWLITLIILAIVAFFIVKYMKSQSQRASAEQERLGQSPGIEGALERERPDRVDSHGSAIGGANSHPAGASTTNDASSASGSLGKMAGAGAIAAVSASATVSNVTGAAKTSRTGLALDSGNVLEDVREMIKILNLAEPDARRLSITPEQLRALRNADVQGIPDTNALDDVAVRLRKMLA